MTPDPQAQPGIPPQGAAGQQGAQGSPPPPPTPPQPVQAAPGSVAQPQTPVPAQVPQAAAQAAPAGATPEAPAPVAGQPAQAAAPAGQSAASAKAEQSKLMLKQAIDQGNVPGMVTAIIDYAISVKSSDIHVEPGEEEVRIRYRIDGICQIVMKYNKRLHPAIVSRVKIISNLKIDEQRIPQDGRASFTAKDPETGRQIEADLRVSTLPTVNGEKIVMRIQDKTKDIPDFDVLGIRGNNRKFLNEMLVKPNGIMLVSGPTGSGKTTTLYSSLNILNTEEVNILTIEDPVEYQMGGLNQSQVRPDIGYSFANGLRTALRQDPDIIMIGEIRDAETIEIAIRAALTGHLVLSTIHTNSAVDTITRVMNMGVPGYLIAAAVRAICAQRLVRKICPDCKEPYEPGPEYIKDITETVKKIHKDEGLDPAQVSSTTFYHGKGCNKCSQTGYKGRIAVYEILLIRGDLSEMIVSGATPGELLYTALQGGMTTLKQDGVMKVLSGETTMDEVYRVAGEF